jgi:hypothetical protein
MSKASGKAGQKMEKIGGGATRTDSSIRDDPEGYLSPLVVQRYCEYMTLHRLQSDGEVRASDNWQNGDYGMVFRALKGAWRHFMHLWTRLRGYPVSDGLAAADAEEDLCALLFNVNVMLHYIIKERLDSSRPTLSDQDLICSASPLTIIRWEGSQGI